MDHPDMPQTITRSWTSTCCWPDCTNQRESWASVTPPGGRFPESLPVCGRHAAKLASDEKAKIALYTMLRQNVSAPRPHQDNVLSGILLGHIRRLPGVRRAQLYRFAADAQARRVDDEDVIAILDNLIREKKITSRSLPGCVGSSRASTDCTYWPVDLLDDPAEDFDEDDSADEDDGPADEIETPSEPAEDEPESPALLAGVPTAPAEPPQKPPLKISEDDNGSFLGLSAPFAKAARDLRRAQGIPKSNPAPKPKSKPASPHPVPVSSSPAPSIAPSVTVPPPVTAAPRARAAKNSGTPVKSNAERVLEWVTNHPDQMASEIARGCGIGGVHAILGTLEERGLVRSGKDYPTRWAALSPEAARAAHRARHAPPPVLGRIIPAGPKPIPGPDVAPAAPPPQVHMQVPTFPPAVVALGPVPPPRPPPFPVFPPDEPPVAPRTASSDPTAAEIRALLASDPDDALLVARLRQILLAAPFDPPAPAWTAPETAPGTTSRLVGWQTVELAQITCKGSRHFSWTAGGLSGGAPSEPLARRHVQEVLDALADSTPASPDSEPDKT